MPITFPTSPSDGDNLDFGGYRWTYNATTGAARWVGVGFTPIVDPFADFVTTTYAGPSTISTTNISTFDEPPFNFGGNGPNDGQGIATDSVATSGVVALWQNQQGQGSAILLPTDLVASSGMSIMGSRLNSFTGSSSTQMNMAVQLVDGSRRRASIQSTGQGSGGSFGLGGPFVSGNQVMSGGAGFTIDGTDIMNHADVARIEFRIPAGNGGTGTENNTVVLLLNRDTVVSTLTSSSPSPGSGGTSLYYNYRWGVLDEAFNPPPAQ